MNDNIFKYIFGTIAFILVISVVAWGIYVSGGPSFNRELRIDEHRIRDVSVASNAIHAYYQRTSVLPDSMGVVLEEAKADRNKQYAPASTEFRTSVALRSLLEASKHELFAVEYVPKDAEAYQLCTTFLQKSEERTTRFQHRAKLLERWKHPAGRHCFEFKVTEPAPSPAALRWL